MNGAARRSRRAPARAPRRRGHGSRLRRAQWRGLPRRGRLGALRARGVSPACRVRSAGRDRNALAVRRAAIGKLRIGELTVEQLNVDRLTVRREPDRHRAERPAPHSAARGHACRALMRVTAIALRTTSMRRGAAWEMIEGYYRGTRRGRHEGGTLMRISISDNVVLLVLGGFLAVTSMAFGVAVFTVADVRRGHCSAGACGAGSHRHFARACPARLDGVIGLLGAWTIVASMVFGGLAITWLGFASGVALVALAFTGLTSMSFPPSASCTPLRCTPPRGSASSPALADTQRLTASR